MSYLFQSSVNDQKSLTGIEHPKYVDRSEVGNLPSVFQPQDEVHGQAKVASWYVWKYFPQIRFPARYPGENMIKKDPYKVYEQDIYIDGITALLCDMGNCSKSAR